MYSSTKLDIDRHVEECLRKINNESERNLRCFSFAKQYFKIERYEEARRYILAYLNVKPDSAEAHYLHGRILEKLGKKEAAYQAYSTSLRLDPKQNNLVLKVCELLASDDMELDHTSAKYFCERAESFDPQHPAVSLLKQRLVSTQNDDPRDVTNLLLKELEQRPTDVQLRIRLLRHLLQYNMIKEAYKHVTDIETKDWSIFHNNLNWYEVVAQVLIKHQKNTSVQSNLGSNYWFLLISVLDRLTSLCLDENFVNMKTTTDYVTAVFNFDQTLLIASQNLNDCTDKQLVQEFLNHYRGQLYLHLITLMFKQANKEFVKHKEELYMILPLLFAAYHSTPPDLTSMWYTHLQENKKSLIQRWRKEACFRCSQVGHILASAAKERKSIIMEKATQYSTGLWRDQLFKKLFVTRDHQIKMSTSFLLSDENLVNITMRLPEKNDLINYDTEAQLLYPDSLHHHIWINLNNELGDIKCTVFEGLQYSIRNLKNCGAETINFLDIQTFIYAATFCAKSNLDKTKNSSYYNSDKLNILPAAVTQDFATIEQNKFFKAAYKIYKNESSSGIDQMRSILIDGIKIIRCVDHVLDVKLLVKLANIFEKQSKLVTKQSEIDFNEARAALYWKVAVPLLEKLRNNMKINIPPNNLFNLTYNEEMSMNEICTQFENGKLFQAQQFWKKKEYEKALRILENLKDPYASFYQAQIYKQMADQFIGQNKENVTSEMRSQNIILLSRARDCLYLTLDRLREPSVDQRHPLNARLGTEIEKMELLLSRIDPDCTNRTECDQVFDGNVSSNNSDEDLFVTGYTMSNNIISRPITNSHSTPYRSDYMRREAKPSPERLDAQLRQLSASKDASLSHILEHNKIIMESHRNFVDELRGFKEAINHLTATVDELKDIKTCVHELKNSISELDNFKTITDMVYEMKKEIAELKKDINKTNQLSDEDIYGLTGDYGTDYNIQSNLAAYNTNMYQNYQNRGVANAQSLYGQPPPPPPPTAPLYPIYPAMAYAYSGLGLSHITGNLPVGTDQQLTPDFRTIQSGGLLTQPNISYNQPLLQTTLSNTTIPTANLGLNLSQTPMPSIKDPKIISTTTTILTPSSTSINVTTSKAPPVNVVITASDPLPSTQTITTTSQPILSVTIPVEHLKNKNLQAHNYQIPLPTSNVPSTSPSILSKPPPAVTTKGLLMNVAPPVYSAIKEDTPVNVSLGLQIEKTLDQSLKNDSIDKSIISNTSLEEHDPCPDFKPLIPLPDEVPVTTGEENEIVLFCEHARLYRHVTTNGNKEWKERGIGNIKILKNPQTNRIRILMRRDQIHKICANHLITKDMILTVKDERSYIWAAHDYADEELAVEKFCVRFKTTDIAKKFYDAFENAKNELSSTLDNKQITRIENSAEKTQSPATLGGFVFSGTPVFKPKENISSTTTTTTPVITTTSTAAAATTNQLTLQKQSPFFNFTFTKQTPQSKPDTPFDKTPVSSKTQTKPIDDNSSNVEDFGPTAELQPVVPLSELVEVKTGEENCEVLFENRSKLLRFDTNGTTKEWKERGVGVMKLLKDGNIIRLIMRRDQVHKVCCNHQLLKDMNFKIMKNNPVAVTWCAEEFSEGVIKNETFALKFKTEDITKEFLKAICSAQEILDNNNYVKTDESNNKHIKNETPTKTTGFGDKFKPVKCSWECKNCCIVNEAKRNYCVACDLPKNDNLPKKSDSSSGAAFSFGVSTNFTTPPITTTIKTTATTTTTITPVSGWGDLFKPKEGSWECQSCLVRNNADKTVCDSCTTPKSGSVVKKSEPQSVNLDTGGLKFNFGIPATTTTTSPNISQAPQTTNLFSINDWECKSCYSKNSSTLDKCKNCGNQKIDDKTTTVGQKFTFGLSGTTSSGLGTKATFTFGQTSISSSNTQNDDNKPPLFGDATTIKTPTETIKKSETPSTPEKFILGSSPKTQTKPTDDDSSNVEDFVPTAEFQPVVPLPELVEVKTGEENCEVLFENRSKLLRFDTNGTTKEWKERGVGVMKLLKDGNIIRLVMRRDQVHKVCCNHQLLKDMNFKIMKNNPVAVTWCAKDFSEGVIKNETFALKFKTEDITKEFLKAICSAQEILDNNNYVKTDESNNKHIKNETPTNTTGFGDKFKPVKGSWECKNCYIVNEAKRNYCVACDSPKNDNLPKKSDSSSGAAFSFGVSTNFTTPPITTTIKTIATTPTTTTPVSGWGDLFKPKEGSWECQSCLVRNNPDKTVCDSCTTPKSGSVVKKSEPQSVNLDTGGLKFNFGIPATTTTTSPNISQAPQTTNLFSINDWECKSCYSKNSSTLDKCKNCGNQKIDDKTTTVGQKFTFGLSGTSSGLGTKATFTFGQTSISSPNTQNDDNKPPLFSGTATIKTPTETIKKSETPSTPEKFIFGSPQKHDFEFTPRSPRRISTGQKDDKSENSYVEEECDNIYFKPVIPLPDKVDVKTGEEDEDVLYCHRAKLFRFASGEWKERGLGEIKILKHKVNGKLRIVMRREQIFKICLNHVLTSDIKYVPKDDKTWLFSAPDFSEGVLSNDQFCIRFKNAEIAQDFKKAIDSAVAGETSVTNEKKSELDKDVEIVSETTVTAEEEQEAIKLGLPPKFMSYRQLSDCKCEQCRKDDEYLNESTKNVTSKNVSKTEAVKPVQTTTTTVDNTLTNTSTLKNLLSKPSLIVPSTTSDFSSPISTSGTSTFTSSGNVFTPKSTTTEPSAINKFSFVAHTGNSQSSPTIFGNTSNIFNSPSGPSPLSKSATIFGGSSSIFKTPEVKPTTGSVTNTTTTNTTTTTTTSLVFGTNTNLFSNSNIFSPNSKSLGSIFGTSTTQFGKFDDSKSIFGGGIKSVFNTSDKVSASLKETDSPLLNSSGDTFASLAAKVSPDAKPAFVAKESSGDKPFAFLGAGMPVFASLDKSKTDKNKSTNNENDESAGNADEEYDPHYEPIVPLPDAIVVSTGEEDETSIFNERAKLYRFDSDTKEWKERGVGQMKILFHPVNKTYRFLMRREQIHKVVLNQLIRPDLDLQPMSTSETAWVWAGNNYLDEGLALEKLAVRFKTCELRDQFYKVVQDAIAKLKENPETKPNKEQTTIDTTTKNETQNLIPSSIQTYGVEDVSADEHDGDDDEDEEYYEEDEDDYVEGEDEDDEDDRTIMFMKQCTLSEEVGGSWNVVSVGDLQVFYEPDTYTTKISVTNESNQIVSTTIIGVNTVMEIDKNSCIWTGVEWAEEKFRRRKLKATFSNEQAAQEFHCNYVEGLGYAQQFDIVDSLPEEESGEES